ncbi:ParB/RepB/Spo0J family partition protein [Lachnoclostridium sp. Marseille-P6806]|uniref:ParB/RepB/Spo0J family partition protein n=1 Tax=Lachnoclostridium sp. Marseille-P6806 TaxID=2364793 RepID=UPI00103023ED|nr:ParB/RepB/Spo0J family partition protein [Lachnoclostridium sp. Marseille-P6806]
MATKRHGGLGRGIDALFSQSGQGIEEPKKEITQNGENNPAGSGTTAKKEKKNSVTAEKLGSDGSIKIRLTKVEPNRKQPRMAFDQEKLDELADSIKKFGLLEPLIVRTVGTHYEIIAGERRWRAAKQVGLKEVPVIIRNNLTEKEVVELSLIENIQREQLNPIEEAKAYKRLIEEFHLTQDEAAGRVSKSRAAVTNSLRLLKLCNPVQAMLINEKISAGHARALIVVEDGDEQYRIAQEIVRGNLSVRETEKLIRKMSKPEKEKTPEKKDHALELIYQEYEEKLKTSLGTKVSIQRKKDRSGKIEIEYYSDAEFERLARMLTKSDREEI